MANDKSLDSYKDKATLKDREQQQTQDFKTLAAILYTAHWSAYCM
jgi:hypothetical protein